MSANTFITCFVIISVAAAAMDFILAFLSLKHRTHSALLLRFTCGFAGAVVLFYSLTALSQNYQLFSVASSLYFASISIMLTYFFFFTMDFTGHRLNIKYGRIILIIVLFDVIVQLINIFKEISVHYVFKSGFIDTYTYQMGVLFRFHLFISYALLAGTLSMLIHKQIVSPSGYKKQYGVPIAGIVVVALINATYLFLPKETYNILDFSVLGYPIASFFMYWSALVYKEEGMLDFFRALSFNKIEQGIVMFDYQDNMILWNNRAEKLIPQITFAEKTPLHAFKECFESLSNAAFEDESISLQCDYRTEDEIGALRCDYQPVFSSKGKLLGRMFVFTSLNTELDLLTGFQNIDGFGRRVIDNPDILKYPADILVIDINKLEQINTSMGDAAGDLAIRKLSEVMRENLPKDTQFVRGREAMLAAVFPRQSQAHTNESVERIIEEYNGHIQFGVCTADGNEVSVRDAALQARDNMRIKKLLDVDSNHSAALSSLVRALEETDVDTDAHVRRTRHMGVLLAERMGMNDTEVTQLALLCLLHDIGKIGIPLEILNKPGRLTEAEWNVLKSHVEKGYQICSSTTELACIADMVRYHHERWDGKGYPDGIAGLDIPILSRTIAVIDAYDAMVNDRSYRLALPEWEAREELKRCAGTQFDPLIVDSFLALLTDMDDKPIVASIRGDTARRDEAIAEEKNSEKKKKPIVNIDGNTHVVKYSRYVLDKDNIIVAVDDNFEIITGYTREDIKNGNFAQRDLIPAEDLPLYLQLVSRYIGESGLAYFEHRLLKKDGDCILVLCIGKEFYDSAEKEVRTEIMIADSSTINAVRKAVEEERQDQRRRKYKSVEPARDSLTGLLTVDALKSEVDLKLVSSKKKLMLVSIALGDFDDFCDRNGMDAGEDLLFKMAQTLNVALRQGDFACKMEGGKFAALIEFNPNISEARMKARITQISEMLKLVINANAKELTLSVGVAVAEKDDNKASILIERAEQNAAVLE